MSDSTQAQKALTCIDAICAADIDGVGVPSFKLGVIRNIARNWRNSIQSPEQYVQMVRDFAGRNHTGRMSNL